MPDKQRGLNELLAAFELQRDEETLQSIVDLYVEKSQLGNGKSNEEAVEWMEELIDVSPERDTIYFAINERILDS